MNVMNEYDLIYKVGGATATLLTYYENKPYKYNIIPVTVKRKDKLEDYNFLVVYEEKKEAQALAEIEENFSYGTSAGFYMPSDNYIKIAHAKKRSIFNTYVTFSDKYRSDTNENIYVSTRVINRNYKIINDFFDDWYDFKTVLGDQIRSDDMEQAAFVFGASARRRELKAKKQVLVKTKK